MRVAHFHEDDYRQLELLPNNNLAWCEAEVERINRFSEAHRDGVGWTDVYVRGEAPVPLRRVEIPLGEFEKAMTPVLPRFDAVTTGYGSLVEETRFVFAFGLTREVVIYIEAPNGYLETAWLDVVPTTMDGAKLAEEALLQCSTWGLMLVDWGWGSVVPLNAHGELSGYLARRLDAFRTMNEQHGRPAKVDWTARIHRWFGGA